MQATCLTGTSLRDCFDDSGSEAVIDGTDSAAAMGGRTDSDDGAGLGGIALCLSNEAHGKSAFEIEHDCRTSDGLLMMNFRFKMINSVFKKMNSVFKMMNVVLQ